MVVKPGLIELGFNGTFSNIVPLVKPG